MEKNTVTRIIGWIMNIVGALAIILGFVSFTHYSDAGWVCIASGIGAMGVGGVICTLCNIAEDISALRKHFNS